MNEIILMENELKRRNYSEKTIRSYLFYAKRFMKKINKETKYITKSDIKIYLENLANKNKSSSTLNLNLSAIKFLFSEILKRNMNIDLKYSKRAKRLPEFLTRKEMKKILDVKQNEKHNLIVKLFIDTGIRLSELINLKISNINLEDNIAIIKSGKGNKDRIVVFSDMLKNDLKRFIENNKLKGDDLLFKGIKGKLHPRTVEKIIKATAKKADIDKNVYPHALRHSFASLAVNENDILAVKEQLGHKDINTTMIYTHLQKPKLKNSLDILKE